ncbi:DUF262 domain-containing protein [Acinetobacter sp. c3-l95]|uniref:DUF262 domain-containing protein n=1 Tax=Acinetobacter sp. c3-l95 TaxID=3342804 RepID=UPI0035BA29BF
MSNDELAKILNIKDILANKDRKLSIPEYQRPYKWQIRHVQQLANDLLLHFKEEKIYRIGTVVIHKNDNYDIVDGQQRIVTLSLLLYVLGLDKEELCILKSKFNHSISYYNIKQNYDYLKHYVEESFISSDEIKQFKDYILNTCQMVYVELNQLDEAFQFFDSQNARGKPLESYDLLKAYHLREMKDKPESVVKMCVKNWEKTALASDYSVNLDMIINKVLFRLRRWQYAQDAEYFDSGRLDTFKGVSENRDYPYLNAIQSAMALQQFTQGNAFLFQDKFTKPCFQINQPILNGEYFFHYIQYYCELYEKLFNRESGRLTLIKKINGVDLRENLIAFLDSYTGCTRAGDRYLRRLFENVVISYFDKFGDVHIEHFVNKAFWWVYRLRFHHQRIGYTTMQNEAIQANSLLNFIERANTPEMVLQFQRQSFEEKFDNVDETMKSIFGLNEGESK